MRELREETALAGRVNVRVLISGEYGVGKRRLARLIHQYSARAHAPFVAVRCKDTSDAQLSRRLFGDSGGATGAFEHADGGTVLLEDVDSLSPAIQHRLRRFLDTGEIEVRGSEVPRRPNVRLISAMTRRLDENRAADDSLADFYYLLNTVYLPVAPLRARTEDVEPLLEFFTAYYARRSGVRIPSLTTESRANCRTCDWPANLRQLQAAAAMFVLPIPPARPADILQSAERMARSQRPPILTL